MRDSLSTPIKIAIISGDGIGPELTEALLKVLRAMQAGGVFNPDIRMVEAGDRALIKFGEALPQESLDAIMSSDVCIKGPVGETAADVIVRLRQALDLYANVRPAKSFSNRWSLKPDVDLVIVRENTEDLYRGLEYDISKDVSIGIRVISDKASERIARYAFQLAEKRRHKVTAVHKSNVLKVTCGRFAAACRRIARDHEGVAYEEQYVDACSANLIRNPDGYDVILTTNLFGDILSDEAAQVVGGLGLAPAGNIGDRYAIFEPVHGAAFDIANKGIANPTSILLSASMMLEWLGMVRSEPALHLQGQRIKQAVERALNEGKYLTPDLGGKSKTLDFADRVCSFLVKT